MKSKFLAGLATGLVVLGMAAITNATPVTSSTGDLGYNVVRSLGDYTVNLNAVTPSDTITSSLVVKFGLWNSPDVIVDTFFDGHFLGTFTADNAYISSGPDYATFDITGLLLDGTNTILFRGEGTSGDYVIGQVDINYDNSGTAPVPEPTTVFLLGGGLAGLAFWRRRNKQ